MHCAAGTRGLLVPLKNLAATFMVLIFDPLLDFAVHRCACWPAVWTDSSVSALSRA